MKLLIRMLLISLTILPFAKTTYAEELIIWSRGGWSDWMVEGFNKKILSLREFSKKDL